MECQCCTLCPAQSQEAVPKEVPDEVLPAVSRSLNSGYSNGRKHFSTRVHPRAHVPMTTCRVGRGADVS